MGASEGRRVRARHRVEYAVFRMAAGCAGLLPGRWVQGLGAVAGWLAGSVLGIRRRVTAENLARAFPEQSSAWRARVARESYRHLGRTAATTFRLARLTRAEILALSRVEGRELLAEPVARGEGAILVTGHIGNWEVGGGALACRGLPLDVVVRPQNNPLFDRAAYAGPAATGNERGRAQRPGASSCCARSARAVSSCCSPTRMPTRAACRWTSSESRPRPPAARPCSHCAAAHPWCWVSPSIIRRPPFPIISSWNRSRFHRAACRPATWKR